MGMVIIKKQKDHNKVLITGSSGFLGRYILNTFIKFGDELKTVGRKSTNDFQWDLSENTIDLTSTIYDIVVHCAGKAHMTPNSEEEKEEFYNINVRGTENLLKSLNDLKIKPKAFVFISSVAVYGLVSGNLINEESSLKATDSYGHTKIIAEKIIQLWCKENKVICSILRLPLIAGSFPLGNLKKMINGIRRGYYVNIDGGKAKKSMVLAEDVANFIPIVSYLGGIYNLTDGQHPNFSNLSKHIADNLGKRHPYNIPKYFAFILSKIGDLIGNKFPINSDKLLKITSDLTFDDSKARRLANWNSTPVLDGFKVL